MSEQTIETTTAAPTRPVASRHAARRANRANKTTRYTLDLQTEQHRFLKLFAVSNDVEASKVMRTLLYLLETKSELPEGSTLEDLVLDELFAGEDEEYEG